MQGGKYKLVFYRGAWCAYWREDSKPKRESLHTADKHEAEREFKYFLERKQKDHTLIKDIYPAYLKWKKYSDKHPAYYNGKALLPFFGHYHEGQVTRELCEQYAEKRDVSPGTIHRELTMLRAAIRWHNKNTTSVFSFPQKPPPKDRYLTKEEAQKLIAGARANHIKLFIELALATAGRVTAILELEWERVDFKRGLIDLRTGEQKKTKRRAEIPMTKRVRELLIEAERGSLSEYVIEYGGNPVKSVRRGVNEAAKRAGLENVTPHVLRHTAAVWMVEAGVPMTMISQYLGHSSTKVTEEVYARYSPEYLQAAANALEF